MRSAIIFLIFILSLALPRWAFAQENENQPKQSFERFAFGVDYVPYYSGDLYAIKMSGYATMIDLVNKKVQFSALRAHFDFFILRKLSLILSIGYNGFVDNRNYIHEKDYPPYQSQFQNSFYEYDYSSSLKRLCLDIGVRTYLLKREMHKVAPYLQFGLGKTFASGDFNTEESSSQQNNQAQVRTNAPEFLEDFNSPFTANGAFGAEYYFNNALSLNAFILFQYATRKATYSYQKKTEDYTEGAQSGFKRTDVQTQIGLGLAFYF